MRKRKINSRNTENPYELIRGIELISKDDKNIRISIFGEKFSADGKKHAITVSKFGVIKKINDDSDLSAVRKLFKNLERFAKYCNNPLEVITTFLNAYKSNKDYFNIKIITMPAYSDGMDSKFVRDSLL